MADQQTPTASGATDYTLTPPPPAAGAAATGNWLSPYNWWPNRLLPATYPTQQYGDILPYEFIRGLVDTPRVLANDVAALVTAPGAAARGQLPPEQQMGLAPQLASGAFTLGMLGEAPEGAFTAFGSTQAKRMPAGVRPLGEALDRHASWAKQGLEDSVAAKDDIWRSTGWYKDVDGRWKFEIPDAGASHLRQDFLDKYAGGAFEPNPMAGDSPYTRQVK